MIKKLKRKDLKPLDVIKLTNGTVGVMDYDRTIGFGYGCITLDLNSEELIRNYDKTSVADDILEIRRPNPSDNLDFFKDFDFLRSSFQNNYGTVIYSKG